MHSEEYIKNKRDFINRSMASWVGVENSLAPVKPARLQWDNIRDIADILNRIGSTPERCNHLLFPDGGGLDLLGAKLSSEENCIELDVELPNIIKPVHLIYENIDDDPLWSYYWMELHTLEPAVVDEDEIENRKNSNGDNHYDFVEEVCEVSNGEYTERGIYENKGYEGYEWLDSARVVVRYLKGRIIIVPKTGFYNSVPSNYDGKHNKLTSNEFRKEMEEARRRYIKGHTEKYKVSPLEDPEDIYYSSMPK